MSVQNPTNMPASVKQRLLNISRIQNTEANLIFTRYAIERLLYRISISDYSSLFILKGAVLFWAWTRIPYRSTMDLDLMVKKEIAIPEVEEIFRKICCVDAQPDGVEFKPATVKAEDIREGELYHGRRVRMIGFLGTARINVQIDIGFGDKVVPAEENIKFPVLLDFPVPSIKAYNRITVVAEKFEAMVNLGMQNSRMKDFYDIWILRRDFEFEGEVLVNAVKATFQRRKTELPQNIPLALTTDFYNDHIKKTQWKAFISKGSFSAVETSLKIVAGQISDFILPPLNAIIQSGNFQKRWPPGGPWE